MGVETYKTLTDNGSTDAVTWQGGNGVLSGVGDYGGGKLYLEISYDNGASFIKTSQKTDFLDHQENSMVFYHTDGGLVRATLENAANPDLEVFISSE